MARQQQFRTPLFDAVINYAREAKISFHTPGHKHGASIPQEFRNFVGERIFDCDLTLLEEVDSLHDPTSVIKEAQALAASAFGADRAFFLVNGSSAGNHAMIMSTCRPGDKIIVPRNAHRSVLAGIVLAGAEPVYIMPELAENHHFMLNVTPAAVAEALAANPDARAVLVNHPTYQGVCADLKTIARLTHDAGALLLVDEAHGPHLRFHPALPASAMSCGADMCVQSTHKILSGLTQASLLLARRSAYADMLRRVLTLLTTTSPSYILMASLDVARMQMATRGRELLETTVALAMEARRRINQIPGLHCLGREWLGHPGVHSLDMTKLVVDVRGLGETGHAMAKKLNERHGVQVEYAELDTLLIIVTIGNTSKDIHRLITALEAEAREAPVRHRPRRPLTLPAGPPEQVMTPRDAFEALHHRVPLREAAGAVAAETISPYPPGIPLVNPGERITPELVAYLQNLQSRGGRLQTQHRRGRRLLRVRIVRGGEEKKATRSACHPRRKKG